MIVIWVDASRWILEVVRVVKDLNEEVSHSKHVLVAHLSHLNLDIDVNPTELSRQFLDHLLDRVDFSTLSLF